MNARRWFDRWQWTNPETRCHCGHLLRRHPTERFRSCSDCVWCDDFREPPIAPKAGDPHTTHAGKQESPNPSGLGL